MASSVKGSCTKRRESTTSISRHEYWVEPRGTVSVGLPDKEPITHNPYKQLPHSLLLRTLNGFSRGIAGREGLISEHPASLCWVMGKAEPQLFVACRRLQNSKGAWREMSTNFGTQGRPPGRSVIISQAFPDKAAFRYAVSISLFIDCWGTGCGHHCPMFWRTRVSYRFNIFARSRLLGVMSFPFPIGLRYSVICEKPPKVARSFSGVPTPKPIVSFCEVHTRARLIFSQ